METEEKRKLLNDFLERWPEDKVRKMTLSQYVGVEDKDTFTYWVETMMRDLGSMKGMTSIKFGIYLRDKKKKKTPKNYKNDADYSWMKKFGSTREEAFENVKKEILQIIKALE